MDDHMYDLMFEYAECELIPRFKEEYKACEQAEQCKSYEEVKDLCTALNAVAKYAGYEEVNPLDLL